MSTRTTKGGRRNAGRSAGEAPAVRLRTTTDVKRAVKAALSGNITAAQQLLDLFNAYHLNARNEHTWMVEIPRVVLGYIAWCAQRAINGTPAAVAFNLSAPSRGRPLSKNKLERDADIVDAINCERERGLSFEKARAIVAPRFQVSDGTVKHAYESEAVRRYASGRRLERLEREVLEILAAKHGRPRSHPK